MKFKFHVNFKGTLRFHVLHIIHNRPSLITNCYQPLEWDSKDCGDDCSNDCGDDCTNDCGEDCANGCGYDCGKLSELR